MSEERRTDTELRNRLDSASLEAAYREKKRKEEEKRKATNAQVSNIYNLNKRKGTDKK